jgi:hypothetical protein
MISGWDEPTVQQLPYPRHDWFGCNRVLRPQTFTVCKPSGTSAGPAPLFLIGRWDKISWFAA